MELNRTLRYVLISQHVASSSQALRIINEVINECLSIGRLCHLLDWTSKSEHYQ